jgi:hypothetical protein
MAIVSSCPGTARSCSAALAAAFDAAAFRFQGLAAAPPPWQPRAMSASDDLAPLVERVLAHQAPVAAIDVRASTTGYDRDVGRCRARLEIRAVLARPGDDDSRYDMKDVEQVLAEEPGAAQRAMDLARRLAESVGAALHPASGDPPQEGDESWLELQDPPPNRTWKVAWRSVAWDESGAEKHASGETSVVADRGNYAFYEAQTELGRRFKEPFHLWVKVTDIGQESSCYHMASYPKEAPAKDTLRAWAAEGRSPSAILRAVAAESPGLSPLDRMLMLEAAFDVGLTKLAPLSAFCAGRLSDADLDAAIGPALQGKRPVWTLPLALKLAHAAGKSIGPVLHEFYPTAGGMIGLIIGVREAFDLSLSAAKTLVDTACDGEHHDEVAVMLDAVVRAKQAAGTATVDEWRVMGDAAEKWRAQKR